MKSGLLDSGEGKAQTHTPAASAAAAATSHSLGESISYSYSAVQYFLAIVYAAFVLYVTGTYTHGWIEKLQMLPLCVLAVMAPMLWATMIRKHRG